MSVVSVTQNPFPPFIRWYEDFGLDLIPLRPREKRPLSANWQANPRIPVEQHLEEFEGDSSGMNLGARLGQLLQHTHNVCHYAVDVDIAFPEDQDEALGSLREVFPEYEQYPRVRSGGGDLKFHAHVTGPQGLKSRVLAQSKEKYTDAAGKSHHRWEVRFLGLGSQVVMPPSVHPDTGVRYAWLREPVGEIPWMPKDLIKRLRAAREGSDVAPEPGQPKLLPQAELPPLDTLKEPQRAFLETGEYIGTMDGNESVMSVANALYKAGMSDAQVLSHLFHGDGVRSWLSNSKDRPDSDSEQQRWLWRYACLKPRATAEKERAVKEAAFKELNGTEAAAGEEQGDEPVTYEALLARAEEIERDDLTGLRQILGLAAGLPVEERETIKAKLNNGRPPKFKMRVIEGVLGRHADAMRQAHAGQLQSAIDAANAAGEMSLDLTGIRDVGVLLTRMLRRFAYMIDGDRVVDLNATPTTAAMRLGEFRNAWSTLPRQQDASLVSLWLNNPGRQTVRGTIYRPGGGQIITEVGERWFNNFHMPDWQRTEREEKLGSFLEHIGFLFPQQDRRDFYLDWLACTVARPQFRIKFVPLLVAVHHGVGRGWLDKVIHRLLGEWNCTFTKMATLAGEGADGKYTDFLYEKLHTSIAEVRVTKDRYAIDDNSRDRLIDDRQYYNLKYGANKTDNCYANVSMQSNHRDALELDAHDRRIWVHESEGEPRGEDYYTQLYGWLNDGEALAQLYSWLQRRDAARDFNPGMRAPMTQEKRAMIVNAKSEVETAFKALMERPPKGVMTYGQIEAAVKGLMGLDPTVVWVHGGELKVLLKQHARVANNGKKVWVWGESVRVWILQNLTRWGRASTDELRAELERTSFM